MVEVVVSLAVDMVTVGIEKFVDESAVGNHPDFVFLTITAVVDIVGPVVVGIKNAGARRRGP